MSNNLFLSALMFIIITFISALVAWRLYQSKNGTLRKIMIAYFLVEVFIYSCSALFFWKEEYGAPLNVGLFRAVVLTPKAIVMIWLLSWLSKQNKNI